MTFRARRLWPGDRGFPRSAAITGAEDPYAGYVAAFASPWPGGIAFWRSATASPIGWRIASTRATIGVTATPLGPDRAIAPITPTRSMSLSNGTLASVDELRLLGGANLAAIENADGEWEVIQFRDAPLIAPSTYRLSLLCADRLGPRRDARSGRRWCPRRPVDGAVTPTLLTPNEARLTLGWRYGPRTLAHTDAAYTAATHTFRPWASGL